MLVLGIVGSTWVNCLLADQNITGSYLDHLSSLVKAYPDILRKYKLVTVRHCVQGIYGIQKHEGCQWH